MTETSWIAVDWGTSHMRAWAMGPDNLPIEKRTSDKGMGALSPEGYEDALLDCIGDLLPAGPVDAVICGMAGARQGWAEAPYAKVPCVPPTVASARRAPATRVRAYILPGVAQDSPADVMRGEETQIQGFMAANPKFDGVICLPGTHTKWVHVSAGEIVSFQTFMTGEMFALLSRQSVLRHSVQTDGWDDSAFDAAVTDAMSRPAALGARLFSLRAEGLLQDLPAASARARLSGLLIGLELAGARPYWLGQAIALVGDGALCAHYQTALAAQGAQAAVVDVEMMTLAGLVAAYTQLEETRA